MWNKIVLFLGVLLMFGSCQNEVTRSPKPRAYPKVIFPEKVYETTQIDYCDFTFELPNYASVVREEYFFEDTPNSECWFDITYEQFNGSLHCSYYSIQNRQHFDALVEDAFKLVSKHQKRLSAQEEYLVSKKKDAVYGINFELKGPVASPMQFFLTDSTTHFMRGSLYFENKINPDSMAPIHDFIMEDVHQMIKTFEWND